jgi:two-component system, chemotaxis family, chemotaxis protein CheY
VDVLVVDDDDDLREALASVLTERDYTVEGVANGREALEYLRQNLPPQIILIDLTMPVMDARAFLQAYSREARSPSTSVILMTGYGEGERTDHADLAVDGVYRKPFDVSDLLAGIERRIRS